MEHFRALIVACVVAGAALVAAGPAAAGSSCDVLKVREVKKAIGEPVRSTGAPDGVGGACSFTAKDAPLNVVNVWVLEGDDAKTGYEVGRGIGGEAVEGIGDKATYIEDPFNTLYVLDGDTLVYVQYYVFTGDDSPDRIKKAVLRLTRKALARV